MKERTHERHQTCFRRNAAGRLKDDARLSSRIGRPRASACLSQPATAGEPRPFAAYLQGDAQLVVSRQGEDYLGLNVIAWGPNWAWMGLDGSSRNEQGAAVGTLAGKVSGTGVPIRVAFRMSRPAPQRLQFEYELQAEQDTALTYVVVELSPGKTFEGRDAVVQSQGRQSSVRCPFERRGLGDRVDSVRMTDARGGVTAIRFDPPCEIPTDGAARIVLAKDKLPGNAATPLDRQRRASRPRGFLSQRRRPARRTRDRSLVSVAGHRRHRRQRDRA